MERSQPAQVVGKLFTPLNKPCLFVLVFFPPPALVCSLGMAGPWERHVRQARDSRLQLTLAVPWHGMNLGKDS